MMQSTRQFSDRDWVWTFWYTALVPTLNMLVELLVGMEDRVIQVGTRLVTPKGSCQWGQVGKVYNKCWVQDVMKAGICQTGKCTKHSNDTAMSS
jgi:hypothetical protein